MNFLRRTLTILLLWAAAFPAAATFHLWRMDELYSSADGSVQFLEFTTSAGGQEFLAGHTLTSVSGAVTHNFTFPTDLPGDTAGHKFLVGTAGYAALSGVPSPDYVVPDGFFFPGGGTVSVAGMDSWTHGPTPSPNLSLNRDGSTAVNSPHNFAGQSGVIGGGLTVATVSLTGPTTSMQGASVTFTATVTGSSPTGTVQFKDGASNLGSVVALAASVASRSVNTLTVGTHSISAVYSGDGSNSAATSNMISHTVSGTAPPPPPPGAGTSTSSLGSRATVSPTATLFGGFQLLESSVVYILVRGNSLGTLGVTQGFLDAPRVRIYDGQGQDIVLDQGSRAGFDGCSTSSASATPVVNYYQNVRAQPAHGRDACIAQTLAPGTYTFTVTPSTPGVTTDSTASTPNAGEVLFEVTLGGGGGSIARTLGSRATVAQAATLFGGFAIASSSVVYILVRGNSLGTLGVTQSFLDAPRVRLFDSQGHDLATDTDGSAGLNFCLASNLSQKPVLDFYNLVRHQAAEGRDACLAQTVAAGVYTFTVTPSASSVPSAGEVLFEVTLSP
jgi:hypothetical protein